MPKTKQMACHVDILLPNFMDLGGQRVAINLANGLAAAGHAVRMVVFEDKGPFRAYVADGVEVLALEKLVGSVPKVRVVLWLAAYVAVMARDKTPRVVMGISPIMNMLAGMVRGIFPRRVRALVQEHFHVSAAMRDHDAHSAVFRWTYKHLCLPFYRRADVFVTIAKAIADDHVAHWGTDAAKVQLIRNPLDIGAIETKMTEPLPDDVVWEQDCVHLVAVGRLMPQKNFGRLIAWFGDVVAQRPNVRLSIVGQGALETALRAQIAAAGLEKVVRLVGFRPNPYALMARAQMFVLTSDWEGLPQVIGEAMVCGTCVVAHACPSGPDEMIEDGVTGRLVAFDDREAFVNAVVQLVDAPALRTKLAAAGRAFACEAYGMERFLGRYEEVLRDLSHKV